MVAFSEKNEREYPNEGENMTQNSATDEYFFPVQAPIQDQHFIATTTSSRVLFRTFLTQSNKEHFRKVLADCKTFDEIYDDLSEYLLHLNLEKFQTQDFYNCPGRSSHPRVKNFEELLLDIVKYFDDHGIKDDIGTQIISIEEYFQRIIEKTKEFNVEHGEQFEILIKQTMDYYKKYPLSYIIDNF
jgi:hypothetical protein